MRLSPHVNYEPITMCLKGLQLHLAPGTFLTPGQYQASPKHRRLFDDLLAWGQSPGSIAPDEIETFLEAVYDGLMSEHRGRPAHAEAYIAWSLNQLRAMVQEFNFEADKAPATIPRDGLT